MLGGKLSKVKMNPKLSAMSMFSSFTRTPSTLFDYFDVEKKTRPPTPIQVLEAETDRKRSKEKKYLDNRKDIDEYSSNRGRLDQLLSRLPLGLDRYFFDTNVSYLANIPKVKEVPSETVDELHRHLRRTFEDIFRGKSYNFDTTPIQLKSATNRLREIVNRHFTRKFVVMTSAGPKLMMLTHGLRCLWDTSTDLVLELKYENQNLWVRVAIILL
ncbi:hypothetical protein SNEBB_008529 [Seison nebaliae]|nr:hypothetical protein SNEBB_008529 [Seison nebaliae]